MFSEIKEKIKFSYLHELKTSEFFSTLDIFFANYLEPKNEEEAIFLAYLFLISRFGFVSLEIINDTKIYPDIKDLNIDIAEHIDADNFVKKVILGSKNLSDRILHFAKNLDNEYPKKPVCRFKNYYYIQKNYVFETKIIKNILKLINQNPLKIFDEELFFKTLKEEKALNIEQKKAIENAFVNSLSLILGGPGTGKTHVAACLIDILSKSFNLFQKRSFKIALSSFTGKATSHLKSKILKIQNSTDIDAKTLHLLLNLKEGKPKNFDEKKLNYDLIIVDEASMLDFKLTAHLLNAIKNGSRIIFIGDPNQLPPIESGNVFAEISNLKNLAKVHLKNSFRFESNKIISFAKAIEKSDEKALDEMFSKSDFYDIENLSKTKKTLVDMANLFFFNPMPKDIKIDNVIIDKLKDFIILSAIKKGPYGVEALNQEIFSLFYNKAKLHDYLFIPIIITKNNYNLDLFNGQMGILKIQKNIDGPLKKEAYFQIDGKIQKHEIFYLNSYEYAYSISIHKSQGSEFKKVAIVIPDGSESFGKEIFYTALTRAKNEFSIFSTKKIIKNLMKSSAFKRSAISKEFSDTLL